MRHTHHPNHPQTAQQAATQLNLKLHGPTGTITDRPTLRLDFTDHPSGLRIITATHTPQPHQDNLANALYQHDHQHIAEAAQKFKAHLIIITTNHTPQHDPHQHYQHIRKNRPLQLHLFKLTNNNLHELPTTPNTPTN